MLLRKISRNERDEDIKNSIVKIRVVRDAAQNIGEETDKNAGHKSARNCSRNGAYAVKIEREIKQADYLAADKVEHNSEHYKSE